MPAFFDADVPAFPANWLKIAKQLWPFSTGCRGWILPDMASVGHPRRQGPVMLQKFCNIDPT
jgi:hypothetical protein